MWYWVASSLCTFFSIPSVSPWSVRHCISFWSFVHLDFLQSDQTSVNLLGIYHFLFSVFLNQCFEEFRASCLFGPWQRALLLPYLQGKKLVLAQFYTCVHTVSSRDRSWTCGQPFFERCLCDFIPLISFHNYGFDWYWHWWIWMSFVCNREYGWLVGTD